MRVLRTPDERFADLAGYPFTPCYVDVVTTGLPPLRMHYVDAGPADGPVVVLLHGQPTWSYLYRDVITALADTAFVEASRVHNRDERGRFVTKLEALGNHGLRPLPSQANFVLTLFEGALTAEAAFDGLADRGYIVRWLPGQGLPQALRITIGKSADMDAIADALREMAEAAK
jgi:histidinol-phosphate/aromatic aminotransferase/cobyric acid decarboxylase-like protein